MKVESFVNDFQELLRNSPRYNLKQVQVENCGYSDTAVKSKNCYYSFGAFYCEDVYYGRYSRKCTDCSGVAFCANCEGCIECSDCVDCYFLTHCNSCKNCANCSHCEDCQGCQDCFGCIALHQKKYCVFNEQLSKEEYQNWLETPIEKEVLKKKLEALRRKTPLLGIHNFRTENCIGNHLSECRNCYHCYDGFLMEDCLYVAEANATTNCCDLTVCFEVELCYSCIQSPMNYNCNFLLHSDICYDSEFCAYSKNLKNCFGCVYLQEKEYYILNRKVEEKQYHEIVSQIKESLIAKQMYNLSLYFVSQYESNRLETESDPVLEPNIS